MPICHFCEDPKAVFSNSQSKKKSQDRKCVNCTTSDTDKIIINKSFQDKKNELYNWLFRNGATLKVAIVNNENNYRSLFASERLITKQNVVFIPEKCIITLKNAKLCDFVKTLSNTSIFSTHTLLGLYLLEEKYKQQSSFFYPYIKLLPENYKSMPLFFDDETFQELKGSHCQTMLLSQRLSLHNEYKKIAQELQNKICLDDFLWARTAVITRVFNCGKFVIEGLVPISDMMNHSLSPNLGWEYDDDIHGFKMTSLKPILKNMQLFDSYGPKCNSRYFINYGFTIPNNEVSNQVALFFDYVFCKNFDNGFSGYDMTVNYLQTKQKSQFRFQVPAIHELCSDIDKSLVQAMFGFLRCVVDNNILHLKTDFQNEANERKVFAIISQESKKRLLDYNTNVKNIDIARMIESEQNVLHYYINLNDFAQSHERNLSYALSKNEIYKTYWKLLWEKPNSTQCVL